MDHIKHNLEFLIVCLARLDRLSIEHAHMKDTYDQIQFKEIDLFVKESKKIIHAIKHQTDYRGVASDLRQQTKMRGSGARVVSS